MAVERVRIIARWSQLEGLTARVVAREGGLVFVVKDRTTNPKGRGESWIPENEIKWDERFRFSQDEVARIS